MEECLLEGYRHCRQLSDLLDAVACRWAERLPVLELQLELAAVGVLTVDRHRAEVTRSRWKMALPATVEASVDDAVSAAERLPSGLREAGPPAYGAGIETQQVIRYGECELGQLRLRWRQEPAAALLVRYREFARHCAWMIQRYRMQRWSEQRLGRPLLLVGASAALCELDGFIELSANSGLPVLLAGEFGTEKALVAVSIHGGGPRSEGPFIEVNCADPSGTPAEWFDAARGGTLFLNGVDHLTPALQGQVPQYLHSQLGQWLTAPADVRIIASTTADLAERAREGRFSKPLLAELDFLSALLPPLRERLSDIQPLVASILDRHGHAAERKCSPALLAACASYHWPENLFELERVVARLAVMSEGRAINQADILRHAGWITPQTLLPLEPRADEEPGTELDESEPELPEHWVQAVLEGNAPALKKLHDGVRRALLYLAEHYAEPVTLGQLAQQAHVSPSHLTFLFRSELGASFKSFLVRLRIRKAQQILLADPRMRITEVALSVGFADLSHFERSFKRVTGQSAREFRRGEA